MDRRAAWAPLSVHATRCHAERAPVTRVVSRVGVFLAATLVLGATVVPEPALKSRPSLCYQGPVYFGQPHWPCYAAMAAHPATAAKPPFTFRLLSPLLVHVLPLRINVGFAALTVVSLAAAGAVLFDLIDLDLGKVYASIGVGMFILSGAVQLALKDPGRVDALMILCGAVVVWAARRGRWWVASVVLAVGVANHELALMLLVPLLAAAWPRLQRRALLLAGAPLVVFVALHDTSWVYGRTVTGFPYASSANIREVFAYRAAHDGSVWAALVNAVVASFGIGWIAAGIGWRRAPAFYRRFSSYVVVTVAAFAIGADWDRLLALTTVVTVPLACWGLDLAIRPGPGAPAPRRS